MGNNTLKSHYDEWHIQWNANHDEIKLIINDGFYTYITDSNSMFYKEREYENISVGQIIIEVGNILYIKKDDFLSLFDKYKKIYTTPNRKFVNECFNDLLKLGFCELLAHAIVDMIILYFKPAHTFSCAYVKGLSSIEENLKYPINKMIVFLINSLNPLYIMGEEYHPYDSVFLTHIIENDNNLVSVCTQLDLLSLINLDALHSRKNKIKIIQCGHCKTFFIQKHGNNTKWCKNCSEIDFDKKTDDKFYSLYRKSQKTMLQRSYRNTLDTWEYQNKYTTPWEENVKSVINDYRTKNDLDSFKAFIKTSMEKYKPKRGDE